MTAGGVRSRRTVTVAVVLWIAVTLAGAAVAVFLWRQGLERAGWWAGVGALFLSVAAFVSQFGAFRGRRDVRADPPASTDTRPYGDSFREIGVLNYGVTDSFIEVNYTAGEPPDDHSGRTPDRMEPPDHRTGS